MAFKMKPTGGKKDPYSSFHRRGLLTPVKQTTSDKVTANATKEAAQNLNTAEEKLMKEYFDESTKQNVKVFKKEGEGGDGTGIPYDQAYKIAGEKGWLKPGETLEEYTARARGDSTREERTSDGEPDSNPNIAINEVKQEAGVEKQKTGLNENTNLVYTGKKRYNGATGKYEKVYEEVQSNQTTKDDDADHSYTYSNTGDKNTVDTAVETQVNNKQANSEIISGNETTVKQLSPTRRLMNRYMPKKSIAKQESKELDTFEINVTKDKAPDGFNKNEKTEGFRIRKDGTRKKIGGSRTIAGNF